MTVIPAMTRIYINLIKNGRWTIDQVPEVYKTDVQTALVAKD
jgi:hypothetical protein